MYPVQNQPSSDSAAYQRVKHFKSLFLRRQILCLICVAFHPEVIIIGHCSNVTNASLLNVGKMLCLRPLKTFSTDDHASNSSTTLMWTVRHMGVGSVRRMQARRLSSPVYSWLDHYLRYRTSWHHISNTFTQTWWLSSTITMDTKWLILWKEKVELLMGPMSFGLMALTMGIMNTGCKILAIRRSPTQRGRAMLPRQRPAQHPPDF